MAVHNHTSRPKPQPSTRAIARAVDRVFAAQERREAEARLLMQMQRTIKSLRPRWLKGEGPA